MAPGRDKTNQYVAVLAFSAVMLLEGSTRKQVVVGDKAYTPEVGGGGVIMYNSKDILPG